VITTNYILNLRDYLDKNYPKQWQGDLAGVYLAGAWSMLKNDGEARKLISAYRMGHLDPRLRCDYYQPLEPIRNMSRSSPGIFRTCSSA